MKNFFRLPIFGMLFALMTCAFYSCSTNSTETVDFTTANIEIVEDETVFVIDTTAQVILIDLDNGQEVSSKWTWICHTPWSDKNSGRFYCTDGNGNYKVVFWNSTFQQTQAGHHYTHNGVYYTSYNITRAEAIRDCSSL